MRGKYSAFAAPISSVGCNELLLRLADVGAPLEERRRQTGRHRWRQPERLELEPARDVAGRLSEQEAERVLRLCDVAFEPRDLSAGD